MNDFDRIFKLVTKTRERFLFNRSDNDSGKSIEEEIVERDIKYTELLDNYLLITKIRHTTKEIHKWLFFWIVVVSYVVVMCLVYKTVSCILSQKEYGLILKAIPVLVTAFVTGITAVVAIPLTITKYLFNTDEDNNTAAIIQHMQDHDMAGLRLFKERFSNKERKEKIKVINSDNL